MVKENFEKQTLKSGLNVEHHKLEFALAGYDSQEALLRLGVRYMGNHRWYLPTGAHSEYIGRDESDDSDDWAITIDGKTYSVWSSDGPTV